MDLAAWLSTWDGVAYLVEAKMEPVQGVAQVSDSNFQEVVRAETLPVVVFFTAMWCGPCRAMAPAVKQLAGEFEGKVKLCSFDIDQGEDITTRYGVKSVPTIVVYRSGKPLSPHTGMLSYAALRQYILNACED